jgi:molybdopterin converting factor small subunit
MVTIELYGVPRLKAGIARLSVEAASVAEALAALAGECPALRGTVLEGREVSPAYRLSVNGERFVTDPAAPLADGDALILLSADVGG